MTIMVISVAIAASWDDGGNEESHRLLVLVWYKGSRERE